MVNVTTNGELRQSWSLRGDSLEIANERLDCISKWAQTTKSIVDALHKGEKE